MGEPDERVRPNVLFLASSEAFLGQWGKQTPRSAQGRIELKKTRHRNHWEMQDMKKLINPHAR
jgi:hypothetical protein